MRFTPGNPVTPCRLLARAAAAAAAVDAATEKPPAAGGGLGLPWLTRVELGAAAGAFYEAAFAACLGSLCGIEAPVAAMGAALAASELGGLEAEEGALVAVSIASSLLPLAEWRVDRLPGATLLLGEDDGRGAALFYALLARRARSYTPRMGYTLPDVSDPSSPMEVLEARVTLLDALRVAGETSVVYRDVAEGFARSLELSTLPPDEALVEAVRVYSGDSGVARRRGCSGLGGRGWRDSWWTGLVERCSPGDAADLGVLAAFLSLTRKLHPTLLEGEGHAVECLCEELRRLLEDLLDGLNPLLPPSLFKRV